jgi:hypothetical protein
MGRWSIAAVLAVVSVLLCLAPGALSAASPSRAEYVEELEGTCKPREQATEQTMNGARLDVRKGRDAIAADKFEGAAKIFAGTIERIARDPRPPADAAKLAKWFGYLNRQEDYLRQIAAQLHAGKNIQAQRSLSHFIHNGNLANNVTLAFGFDYCSFKFSRFG